MKTSGMDNDILPTWKRKVILVIYHAEERRIVTMRMIQLHYSLKKQLIVYRNP